MKLTPLAASRILFLLLALAGGPGAVGTTSAQAGADPLLTITLNEATQTAVLTWFGDEGVTYQLESSSDLTTWADAGPALAGSGNYLNVTRPIAGLRRNYFRFKHPPDVITAEFNAGTGELTITGGDHANTIVVSRNAAGALFVNDGAVVVTGGVPTVANTALIRIFGRDGGDVLSIDETSGALPAANILGEGGDDTLTGGSGADTLNGGIGIDTLLGKGGNDFLFGGPDNDTLTGGDADDQVFGEAGNDRMIWNPGDDTDLNEGGTESDTVEVNGGNGDEVFTATANGARVRFDRTSPAPFSLDMGGSEKLVLNANGGNDTFSATGDLASLIQITVDGGAGDDTLNGSNGIDLLLGGDNNDTIDGQQGADIAFMGAGDDTFQWDPGDGSDVVEGQAGNDRLLFNGSNGAETFDVSANGSRVRFTRNLGNIVMDLDDIENLDVNALGAVDFFTVNDLTGTDLTSIKANLASTIGGSTGDAAADTVTINGTGADDIITATLPGGDLLVTGLAASILVDGFETALDTVSVQGLGGDDIVDASAVGAGGPRLALGGVAGNDILLGSSGIDNLAGGDNDDVLLGGLDVDVLDGGTGDNIVIQDGISVITATATVFGDALDNTITISRDAGGNILSNGVPIPGATIANTGLIRVFGRGGNDTITFDEANGALPAALLFGGAGTDTISGGAGGDFLFGGSNNDTLLSRGGFDFLFGGAGNDTLTGGDADDQAFGEADSDRFIWNPGDDTDLNEGGSGTDTVEVNGGGGDEVFTTTANGTRVRFDRVNPAPFAIDIGTSENLVLNANGGNDSFSATGNLAALIQITVDGGAGDDTLSGSNGIDLLLGGDNNDTIDGQQGADTAFMGAGDDTFQWDPGDGLDTIEGQAGNDRLLFNGASIAEIFEVSANGARVRFTRNIATVVLDLDDVEILDLNALNGTDSFTVNDLTGTDLTTINAKLASTIGGSTGDGVADTVIINGTAADDIITATLAGGDVLVTGLAASVVVDAFDAGVDIVSIQGLGGDDIVDASAIGAGGPLPTLGGGTGNDILLGSAGVDTISGGDNDDVLLGNGGADLLDGGTGDNIVIQDGGNVTSGIVSVFGDYLDNTISISRDAAGAILHNGVPIPGATIANTALIRVFGQGGNDSITFNEGNGALPPAMLFGGAGIDTVAGGAGGDFLFGGADNDIVAGRGGFDFLFGGSGNDTITGGDDDDQAFGGADTDRFIWNPGDDTDLNEGGSGTDTVEVNGGGGAEVFTATANGTRVRFDRVSPAPFAIDIGTSENLVLNAGGGNDSFSATGDLASLIQITVDGGAGDDTLSGSNGIDMLLGGDNNDFIDGQQGNDFVFMGAGDDTFQWDPGDGSDTVEGQADTDTLLFNGSNGDEIFNASANGSRFRFTRNLGNIVMDLDDVEHLDLRMLGGTDTVTVNDLSGTDVSEVNVQLASTIGGTTGDGLADNVIVNGTAGIDNITVTGAGTSVTVVGLPARVNISTTEAANDRVTVNSHGGNDVVEAATLAELVTGLTLNGGTGDDTLTGSAGVDILNGDDNNDLIDGNQGADFIFMGAGNDTFQWNPGDGNDTIEGQAGTDTLLFNGADIAENIDVTANGARMLFFRNVATVTLDCDDVEKLHVNALGGADNLFFGDLSGTDVNEITVDLTVTGGDGQPDSITVNGTNGDDTVVIGSSAANVAMAGLPASVIIAGAEPANDTLTLNALGGLDSVNASTLDAGTIKLNINGGLGNDVLVGSQGGDSFNGGDGNDTVFGAGGDDSLTWNPGDDNDTFEGQAGSDRMVFNGAVIAEILTVSANGSRVSFTRDIANVVMDLNDVETLDLNLLGGADRLTVNNLAGTGLTTINAELTGSIGGTTGDSAIDLITVNGTANPDTINVTAGVGPVGPVDPVEVSGLPALVRIRHSEAANDDLIVNGLGGTDNIIVGDGVSELIGVTANP